MKSCTFLLLLLAAASFASACAASDNNAAHLTAEQCASAPAWTERAAFSAGDVVEFGGAFYQCVQGHTSEPSWTPPAVPALWTPGTCEGGDPDPGNGGGDTGSAGGGDTGSGGGGGGDGGSGGGGGDTGNGNGALLFGPYKDTSVNMDWDTNVISTMVSGTQTVFADDLNAAGGNVVSLAFATGECGNERWGDVPGAAMAAANVPVLEAAGVDYILSTGGAAGSFTCGSDAGFATFLDRWAGPHLVGVDLDIEAGQSPRVIAALLQRLETAHAAHPNLRFSLTVATLANNEGASTARSLGSNIGSSLNVLGDTAMAAAADVFGFDGSAATWPSYVTVNLMTMNYGSPGPGVCVVSGGQCDMGQSAIQAAYNLHDHFGVPYANIELTPMIGGNDVRGELYTLTDVDETAAFARSQGLAGVHYWSYDRDVDCPIGAASPVCNSLGDAGTRGFLARFLAAGL